MPCLEEIFSLEALLVLSALGQVLVEMKGLFLPLMSSFGLTCGSSFTRQKLDPAATSLSLTQSGELWRPGLELWDLKLADSDNGEVGSEQDWPGGLGLPSLSSIALRLSGGLAVNGDFEIKFSELLFFMLFSCRNVSQERIITEIITCRLKHCGSVIFNMITNTWPNTLPLPDSGPQCDLPSPLSPLSTP